MKKIYNYFLIAIAFFALVPAMNVRAQKQTTYSNGLGYSKNISTPDDEGIYTITLEAFTTGNVTVTKKSIPADIVLVLDVSGSMAYNMNSDSGNSNERLNALKTAVNNFIDIINDNDLYYVDADGKPDKTKPREQRLGNRIAIVTYSTNANNRTNGLIALGNSLTDNSGVTSLKTTVNGLTANGGTYAHKGMDMAYGILSPLNDTRQLRTTVFFTDGVPGLYGNWSSTTRIYKTDNWIDYNHQYRTSDLAFIEGQERINWQNYDYATMRYDTFSTANATINSANNIKNLADESKGIISNVYSVSIINNPGRQTQVYLGKTSSNYLGATNMGDWNGTWNSDTAMWNNGNGTKNTDGKNYSFASTSAQGLNEVFETIAGSSGGSDADLGGSTVAVMDIVSANFMLPNGADPDQITVYTAACTGGTEGALTFGDPIPAKDNDARYHKITRNPDGTIEWSDEDYDVDDDIEVTIEGTNMIQVTGFDYASNFCGFENGVARGYKVLIEIPVKMDPNAVGGANSDSNEPGSGIYADLDGDGSLDPIITYDPPKVDLPTNIYIEKEGLKKGESAKFRIERVSKNASEEVKSNPDSPEWEPVTTVFITNTEGDGSKPMVKVRGLDPNYIYQIIEEPWSWAYTSEAITVTRTDLLITNPFKFKNTPKEGIDKQIRHAESKATNDFNGSGSVEYVDSKPRTTASTTTP
ncbi:MAG: VWA domain-containing protein [Bacteroidales bacterium]|nr:VWA domain-containing protein [Bacteroidales bacterium]